MKLFHRAAGLLREEGVSQFFRKSHCFAVKRILYIPLLIFRWTLGLLPRKTGLWVLGDGYRGRSRRGENAKYLFLQLGQRDCTEQLVWVSKDKSEVELLRNNGYTSYHARSIHGTYALIRAEKIFCTNGMDFAWWLTGGAEIIQLWHANTLKKMGWDGVKHRSDTPYQKSYKKRVIYDWDKLVTTSINPPADIIRRSFGIPEANTIVTGYPRTDIFYKNIDHLGMSVDCDLIGYLEGIPADETVFMYAPTWRRSYQDSDRNLLSETELNLQKVNMHLKKNNSYLIVKLHPMSSISNQDEYDRLLFAEPGSDPYPVLKEVDCLITDYSSLYIDYLLLDCPIIFFPYDLPEYTEQEGLYYTYESVTPGFIANDSTELLRHMNRISHGEDPHRTERKVIRKLFHDQTNGKSADRVYDRLT